MQLMIDIQQIQHAADDHVDEVVDGLRQGVKAGVGGADDGTGLREFEHVFEFDQAEGHFSMDDHQAAAFFEDDLHGAGDQVIAEAVGELREFVVGAGDDDHGVGLETSGGDAGPDVFIRQQGDVVFGATGQCGKVEGSAAFHAEFIVQQSAAELGDDEENFRIRGDERFDEPFGVDGSGCAADGDDDAFTCRHVYLP